MVFLDEDHGDNIASLHEIRSEYDGRLALIAVHAHRRRRNASAPNAGGPPKPTCSRASVRGDDRYGVRVRSTAAIQGFDAAP
jgi:hypothetical protein